MTKYKKLREFPDYQFGDDGSVWSQFTNRVIKTAKSHNGYLRIRLNDFKGKRRWMRVNRLICQAFNGRPPEPSRHASHRNGKRTDNRPANLVWKTLKKNTQDKHIHGTWPACNNNGFAKLTLINVIVIRGLYTTGRFTYKQLAEKYGVSISQIGRIVREEQWTMENIRIATACIWPAA